MNENRKSKMTVFMSYDEAKTWPVQKLIDPGWANYSDLKEKAMDRIRIMVSLVILAAFMTVEASAADSTEDSVTKCDIFNTEEILDETTLDIKTLEDWHTDKPTNRLTERGVDMLFQPRTHHYVAFDILWDAQISLSYPGGMDSY